MRYWLLCAAAAICLRAAPAEATDHLLFGPPEAWVVPVTAPAPTGSDNSGAFTTMLDNEQAMLGKGERRYYTESVYRINSPQGLDDGNITLSWDPATDALTVNKLLIHRGSQVIDVLKSGQNFTTMRRETNLEAGMLDGQLTASLMPEGLQVGDIVDLAVTYVHKDAATKDSTEIELATFNDSPIGRGFARLSWPSSLPITFKAMGGLPAPAVTQKGGISTIEYDLSGIEPLVLPSSAPGRFREQRALDASNFANWSDVAALMKTYFDSAAVIPQSGPLRDEVEKIRRLAGDDKVRAAAALKLVEDSVRYVALSMGTGGYVPASAETTWSRRFGDCKAKTALLLAILHELHISSEAVLANTNGNDGLDQGQPQLGWFNHVLVRAHLAGRDYWLDGTRDGDTNLDQLHTPAYDWGLPLVSKAALVRMVPDPLREPNIEVALSIDDHEGIHLPAPTTITYIFRGDDAREANIKYNATPPSQRDQFLRDFFKKVAEDWTTSVISLEPDKVAASYDPASNELRFSFAGKAKLDWSDSNLYLQFAGLAYKPNFVRTEGVNQEAPIAIEYPSYVKMTESIRLPKAFLDSNMKVADIDTTLVGIQYHRHVGRDADALTVETSERTIAAEVPYAQAIAQSPALRDLNSKQLSIFAPDTYQPSEKDMAAWMEEKPASVAELIDRGNSLLNSGREDEAITDFTNAIAIDKTKSVAFADRAIAYIHKNDKEHALADLNSAAALDPADAVMLRGRGLMAENEGKWQDAVDSYSASLVKEPHNNFAVGHRAIAYAALRKDEQALADAKTALDTDPDWNQIRNLRDRIFLRRHQCADALKDAAFMSGQSDNTGSLVLAARLYAECQQRDTAFTLFDKALATKPAGFIYVNRALLRLPTETAARMSDLDAAIRLEPKSTDWLALKADELDRTGNRAAAVTVYDQALKLAPEDFMLALERAVVVYRLGRTDEANKVLSELRARAKNAVELNNLCWAKATAGILLESALADCQAALKMEPDSAGFLDSLGMTLLRLGRYDDAIAAYDKAIAGGTGAVSLMGRSIAYARKGQKALADADKKAAIADNPEIMSTAERYNLPF